MGKNVNRRFTVDLDISTENIEKKVKGTVGNLKTILADLGKASDKMGFFKELTDYLAQVDMQIAMFKQKHGDGLFNQIFGGLDENLRKETEKIFGVAKEQLTQLEQLKEKVAAAKTSGASSDDLKAIEQEVRAVYEAAGMLDKLDLSGKGKVETRIQKIEDALSSFAQVWKDTNNKISKGFNFSETDATSDIDNQIDKINKQLEKLDEIKKEIRAVNKEFHKFTKETKFDGSVEPTIDAVKELIAAYNAAIDKRKAFEKAGDTTSREYYENEMDIARLNLKASDWVENYVNKDADLLKLFKNEKLNGKSLAVLLHRMYDEYNFTLEDAAEPIDETIKNLKKEKRALEKQKKDLSKGTDVDYAEQINKTVKEINDLKAEIAQKADAGLLNEEDLKSYIQKIGELSSAFKILSQSAGMPAEKIKEVEATIDTVSTNLNDSFNKILKQKNKNPISAIYEDATLKVKRAVGEIAKLDKEYDTALGTSAKINAFDKNSPSDLQREYIVEAFREYQKNKEAIKNMSMSDVTDKDIALLEKQLQLLKTINQASIDGAGIEDYKKVYGLDGEELKSFNNILGKKTNQNAMNELLDKLKQGLKERRKNLVAELSKDNAEIAKLIEASGDAWEQFLASEGKKLPQPTNVSTGLNKELEQKAAKNVEEQKRFNDLKSQFDASIKDFTDTGLVDVMGAEQKAYNDVLDGIRNKTINTVEECKDAFAKIANLNYDELIQKNEALKSSKPEQQGPTTGENDGKPDGGVAGQIGEDADAAKNKLAELKRIRDEYMSIIDSLSKKKKAKVNITNKNDTEILKSSLQEMQDAFSVWSTSKNGTEEQLEAYGKLIKAVKNYQSAVDFIEKSGSPRAKNLLQTSDISKATTDANNFFGILDAGQLKKIKNYFTKKLEVVNKDITGIVGDETPEATGAAVDKIEQAGNAAKETEVKVKSLTDVFNEYISTVRKAEDIEWNDNMETAYTQILSSIKDNTFTTVEECVAKFKELANITEVIRSNSDSTGTGVGTGIGTGTGSGTGTGDSSADISAEAAPLETLNAKLKEVKGSVDAKTDAFSDEYIVVDGLIEAEKAQLNELKQTLVNVTSAVEAKTQAFEDEYIVADAAIEAEIESLNRLKGLLTEIQGILQVVFSVSGKNFGDINIEQDKTNVDAVSSAIQSIQQTLGQILSVLQGFTGIESDGKNSIKQKEPVVDNGVASSKATEHLASKLSDLATENTLSKIPLAINNLAESIKATNESDAAKNNETQQSLSSLISTLGANISSLKEVMDGVVVHQKAQKSDTKKAMARIQDPAQFKQISSIAENSVGSRGTDVHIKSLKALSDGLVGVEGAFKNVNGEWEGFTVKVNESNDAVDLAINKQSAFAKVMQKLEEEMKKVNDDDNQQKLSPKDTATSAIIKAQEYDDEGKEVTVQYKDSQRYTVSLKENIGGLQKEVFQTFDESIDDFNERTTVTISNKTAAAIRDTNKLILENTKDVGNANLLTEYNKEYRKLLAMNDRYRQMDNLSQNDIDTWNSQITLVQNLGSQISNLIKQKQKLTGQAGVATSTKRLQEYQTDAGKIFNELDFGLTTAKTDEQKAIVDTYDKIIEKIDLLKKSHSVLTDQQIAEVNDLIDALKKEADAYLDAKKITPEEQLKLDTNAQLEEIEKYQNSLKGVDYVSTELSDKIDVLKSKLNSIKSTSELDAIKEDFADIKKEIDDVQNVFEKINLGYVNSAETKLKGAFNKLTSEQKLNVQGEYEQVLATLEEYRGNIQLGTKVELDSINKVVDALHKKIDAYNEANANAKRDEKKPDKFTTDFNKQKTDFAKYKIDVENALGVTDELRTKLTQLESNLESVADTTGLDEWVRSLNNLKTEISNAQKGFKASQIAISSGIAGKANSKFKELNFKANDNNLTQEQEEIVNKRQELIQKIKEYNIAVNSGQKAEIDGIKEARDELYKLIDAYKTAHNIVSNGGAIKKGQAYGTSQLQNFTARYNSLIAGASEVGLNEQSTVVVNLANAYKQLQIAQSAFVAGEDKTTAEYANKVEVFKAAQLACNNYARELNSVVTASKNLQSEGIGDPYSLVNGEFDLNDVAGRQSALRSYIDILGDSVVAVGNFTDGYNKLHYTIKNGDGTFTAMTATINKARTAIVATAGDTENVTGKFASLFNELKGKFKSIGAYFVASFGIEEVWQQVRQGVQYVREIDSALTELKKVTNETEASYDAFLQSMSKTGSVIGATVQDLTTMAADWARLGYSMEEAGKLAESTAILLNVSEFQDATAASEALISTMQAFQYTADNSQHVVDILNEVGKLLPVDNYIG